MTTEHHDFESSVEAYPIKLANFDDFGLQPGRLRLLYHTVLKKN